MLFRSRTASLSFGMMLWQRGRGGVPKDSDAVRFVLLLLAGIAANAMVSGAIAGVFDRYQGRVAWLASLGFAALLVKMLNEKRSSALKIR